MRALSAIVDSAIRIPRRELGDKLYERIHQFFSVPNPAYVRARRLRRIPFGIPEKLYAADEVEGYIEVPRGAIRELRGLLQHHDTELVFDDRRVLPSERLNLNPRFGFGYLYQRAAASELYRQTQGHVVLPCGGGKTVSGALAIAKTRTPTIVLVPTTDLVDQWVDSARFVLQDTDKTMVGPWRKGIRPVTVATVDTFGDWDRAKTEEAFGRFGMMILDECHHAPAATYRRQLGYSTSRYRLGLTATAHREDGLDSLISWFCGPLLLQRTHQELVDLGVLVVPTLHVVETDFTYSYENQADWNPMLDELCADHRRNAMIVSVVEREAKLGRVCLVLSGRKVHCEALGSMLRERGVANQVLTSSKSKKSRRTSIEAARLGSETSRVLIATSLADEGLDIPLLSRLFLVFPGRAKARTIQRLGRIMRPHPDKPRPVLYDFGDVRVPHLRRQLRERCALYSEILGAPQGELDLETDIVEDDSGELEGEDE